MVPLSYVSGHLLACWALTLTLPLPTPNPNPNPTPTPTPNPNPNNQALAQLRPDDLAFSFRALHWCPDAEQAPYTPQGYDPLALSPSADQGVQQPSSPPEGADVVVLNNNQYAASFKAATRDEVLASACTLSRWLARAVV